MGRPTGRRNDGYDDRRDQLAARVADRLLAPGGVGASLRDLASAADVSTPTLRHYFGDRDGAVAAALASLSVRGAPYTAEPDAAAIAPVAESLEGFLAALLLGWRHGVGRIVEVGLGEGMGHDRLGPATIDGIVEPIVRTAEARLAVHVARGELRGEARTLALALLGPVILALLHQDALGGRRCRPLDTEAFVAEHLAGFLRAWGAAR